MFKCQKCHNSSKYGEKQHKIVVEKKEKTYHYFVVKIRKGRGKTEQITTQIAPDKRNPNRTIVKEFTTKGYEIVKELKICERCANV